jgi:hypothetical protein
LFSNGGRRGYVRNCCPGSNDRMTRKNPVTSDRNSCPMTGTRGSSDQETMPTDRIRHLAAERNLGEAAGRRY